VTAIVLDDEDPYEQRPGRNREAESQPIGQKQRPIHQRAGPDEKAERRQQLKQARAQGWCLVRLYRGPQIALRNGMSQGDFSFGFRFDAGSSVLVSGSREARAARGRRQEPRCGAYRIR